MSFPWLTVIAALPLVGALLLLAVPRNSILVKQAALAVSGATLVLTAALALRFEPGAACSSRRTTSGSSRSARTTRWASTASG
jgi:NADH:ubiquinone oxidoreductase subunit 4 (subunit M)